jgi:cytochrome c-type biogenesis protein CcmH/NrfG
LEAAVTGLIPLFALIAVAGVCLWWAGRVRGAGLQLALAAMMIGGAGYALQGRPGLVGAPRQGSARSAPLPLTEPRHAIFGQFTASERWLIIADSFASRGDTGEAIGAVRAGLRASPRDAALWTGLGNALVDHAGMVTPAASLAYDRAAALAPRHPGPLFFRGLAQARSNQRKEALATWERALALTPPNASYRPIIEGGIKALGPKPPQ